MPKLKLPNQKPDFEAEIQILTLEEGGRENPARNGIRWDFKYDEDNISDGIYIIHPYFIDEKDELISELIPLNGTMRAWMYILFDEMRTYHRTRIAAGKKFSCQEGSKSVARGVVTKLIGLADE